MIEVRVTTDYREASYKTGGLKGPIYHIICACGYPIDVARYDNQK